MFLQINIQKKGYKQYAYSKFKKIQKKAKNSMHIENTTWENVHKQYCSQTNLVLIVLVVI